MTTDKKTARQIKLVELIRANPGLDGKGIKAKGYRPQTHGSLREAEQDGQIIWRDGWYVAPSNHS